MPMTESHFTSDGCDAVSVSSSSSDWQYAIQAINSETEYLMMKKEDLSQLNTEPIDPPLEFQDVPLPTINRTSLEWLAEGLVDQIVSEAVSRSGKKNLSRSCCTPELLSLRRPASRNSLHSRLSSSHNSLSVPAANKADDSSFITSAMSHDVLDMYNVPLDSDIYTIPVDSLKPTHPQRPKRQNRQHRKRRRETSGTIPHCVAVTSSNFIPADENNVQPSARLIADCPMESENLLSSVDNKRHSLPGTSMSGLGLIGRAHCAEPIHMTLQEVRRFLHNLYSSGSSDYERQPLTEDGKCQNRSPVADSNLRKTEEISVNYNNNSVDNKRKNLSGGRKQRYNKNMFTMNIKNRKSKSFNNEINVNSLNNNNINNNNNNNNNIAKSFLNCSDGVKEKSDGVDCTVSASDKRKREKNESVFSDSRRLQGSGCSKNSFSYTLKQTLCNIFRFSRRSHGQTHCHHSVTDTVLVLGDADCGPPPFTKRALPPLPSRDEGDGLGVTSRDEMSVSVDEESVVDFASSIEKVKDYGWYWGPISGETAEKILSNEPDGSFIVRDSSDDHYIFSLTFKLNGVVRHVRIEHDQGNFSFGSCTKFKSHTIVDFIENAVEHSRSGRYLFFLHRRPVHGPMRVQLLHPVSRFKQVQSLQHMCRFVILKAVRRDLIPSLPLPRRIIDYLNTPHYYSEHPSLPPDDHRPSSSPSLHLFSFMPPDS